ncbi:hypothetical protein F4V43_14800 [Paenibacillus spiritus]|uniref:DUF5808 domain-containing protein n=1 Tax=Paenibacillus spiritus TaxID=2496557 RepID=A0A5J5G147_9BACL|nr:DUF5808 domain-containing protein [Paenibacillus spiritus]KAA9000395.1 hypothetical protein F4V43_14800 [Paenibacillus spiritus]
MLFALILGGAGLIVYLAAAASYGKTEKVPGGAVILGTGIPAGNTGDPELDEIRRLYGGRNRRLNVTGLTLLLALLAVLSFTPLADYASAAFLGMLAWTSVMCLMRYRLYLSAHRSSAELKRRRGWTLGEARVVYADTKLALMKNRGSLSPWLHAIPLGLALAAVRSGLGDSDSALPAVACTAMGTSLLYFVLALAFRRMKAKVYSRNREWNEALNTSVRRAYSALWLALSLLDSGLAAALTLLAPREEPALAVWWTVFAVLQTLVPLGFICGVARYMGREKRHGLEMDDAPLATDDDALWINGMTYYNPDDRSVMVAKRTGIGTTFNMATRAGRWSTRIAILLGALVLAGVSALLVWEDFSEPRLNLTASGTVEIRSTMYNFDFPASDIREVALVDKLPGGTKTNGSATSRYARGIFRLKGYGPTRLYVYKETPPYLMIRLADGYKQQRVVFNEKDPAQTRRLYEKLRAAEAPPVD